MKQEDKFEKIVEYQYPNGNKYDGTKIGFYMLNMLFCIFYIITSPIGFLDSELCGHRKVYWKKLKKLK